MLAVHRGSGLHLIIKQSEELRYNDYGYSSPPRYYERDAGDFISDIQSGRFFKNSESIEKMMNLVTVVLVYKIFSTVWSMYSFICVNSLYLQIKENQLAESPRQRHGVYHEDIPMKSVTAS